MKTVYSSYVTKCIVLRCTVSGPVFDVVETLSCLMRESTSVVHLMKADTANSELSCSFKVGLLSSS